MPRRSTAPLFLLVAGLVLILAAVGSFFLFRDQPAESAPISEEGPVPDVARVSLDEARQAYDTGTAVFVDVRAREFYDQSHIPGAMSVPLAELPDRMNELDSKRWIITY